MGLLDSGPEEPKSKLRRYIITGVALAVLVALGLWYVLRFTTEKHTVTRFMDAVVAGNLQLAYQTWHPHPSYSYRDFLSDWGPDGYYGPIKSYRIESAQQPRHGGSGVIITVEISPFAPFPSSDDLAKSRRTREVRIWVERSDQSLSFPP